ncbi:hypothetical protein Q31a_62810 [Aureliella helgolandensis]|uniref:Uncharacterized protein n=1 Tax=Aureliella helgolandensis TaxID=2527968 RepID=A0A518GH49_9BACT|nr:hypothetical protein Q31a_62810 [Aureliella helgolandensis]
MLVPSVIVDRKNRNPTRERGRLLVHQLTARARVVPRMLGRLSVYSSCRRSGLQWEHSMLVPSVIVDCKNRNPMRERGWLLVHQLTARTAWFLACLATCLSTLLADAAGCDGRSGYS